MPCSVLTEVPTFIRTPTSYCLSNSLNPQLFCFRFISVLIASTSSRSLSRRSVFRAERKPHTKFRCKIRSQNDRLGCFHGLIPSNLFGKLPVALLTPLEKIETSFVVTNNIQQQYCVVALFIRYTVCDYNRLVLILGLPIEHITSMPLNIKIKSIMPLIHIYFVNDITHFCPIYLFIKNNLLLIIIIMH